jgi:UDP-glucose 4-epimerase
MNVLVVGGAGYIGSHCVRQLIAQGHRPVVVDNLVYGHRAAVARSVPFYKADLGDGKAMRAILKKHRIELVMHFAAYCYVGESVTAPLKYYQNNLAAPLNLIEAMLETGVKKFVLSSTCATYGVPDRLPLTEDHPQRPINPYGESKLYLENVLKALARSDELNFAVLRYFNAAGAALDGAIGEDHDPETHLIPLAIAQVLGQVPRLEVFGTDYPTPDGTCLRDYVHVDDLARAHILVFDKLKKPGTQLYYNLGTGAPSSVREVIAAVEKASGKKVKVKFSARRAGDPPALYADNKKAIRELGWRIEYPELGQIVNSAWAWHRANPKGFGDKKKVHREGAKKSRQ